MQETCEKELAGARGGEDVGETMGEQGTGPARDAARARLLWERSTAPALPGRRWEGGR